MKKEGNAGEVLTSNGAGAIPSYQVAGAGTATGSAYQIQPFNATSVQGTWTWYLVGATCFNSGFYTNSTTAQNDEFKVKLYLIAGTYSVHIICRTHPAYGKAHIIIDTVDVGNVDCYSAGSVEDAVLSVTGIVLGTTQLSDFGLKISDKNGASSDYTLGINSIFIERTA